MANQGASHGKRGHASVKKQFRPGPLESSTRSGWVVADKAQTYWPRLEGLAPWFLRNANCQDTYELLSSCLTRLKRRAGPAQENHTARAAITEDMITPDETLGVVSTSSLILFRR